MYTTASTPRELCYSIKSACDDRIDGLVARPWNRFDPDESAWWLVPSSDWPAFQYGKLYFNWRSLDRSSMVCGLHIEKGLDPSIAGAYRTKKGSRYILNDTWIWNSFLKDLDSGQVSGALVSLWGAGVESLEIRIEGGYVPDPGSFDPYAGEFNQSKAKYVFEISGGTPSKWSLTSAEDPDHRMHAIQKMTDFHSARAALAKVSEDRWLWIDFFLLLPVSPRGAGDSDRAGLERKLEPMHLSNFSRWLCAGH